MTSTWQPSTAFSAATSGEQAKATARTRLQSIDWFLHMQVSDPANALTIEPGLFFTRLTSTICAPVFIALTGSPLKARRRDIAWLKYL